MPASVSLLPSGAFAGALTLTLVAEALGHDLLAAGTLPRRTGGDVVPREFPRRAVLVPRDKNSPITAGDDADSQGTPPD
ncbi:hypothetical protein DF268_41100 [Streptomyces sp. V2]|uniref:hypothetical protein n=1 Tax=Streptomyces TaxID=1883 RepID=UPI0006EB99E2|nr:MULTISPECIES: hypothetical protein [Streptomyces]PWG07831.1 hypothetical protein DF268_41100 [Streptomyces sp. V2]